MVKHLSHSASKVTSAAIKNVPFVQSICKQALGKDRWGKTQTPVIVL